VTGRPAAVDALAPAEPASRSERVLYGAIVALALLGLVSPGQFNVAPAGPLLELAFLLAAALLAPRVASGAVLNLALASFYVFLKVLLLLLYGSASLPDFVQAYKSYIYLVALAFVVRKAAFQGRRLARVTTFLVAAFLLKYAYSLVLGLADRPGIFIENNFELIMLIGLVHLAWPYLGSRQTVVFLGLAATVLISGSRSAALGLLCVYVGLYLRTSIRTWPLHIAGVTAVGYAVLSVFTSRAADDGAVELDRLVFLNTFLYEVRDWPLWEFLTGSFPLTPLSPGSCASLSFYEILFSRTDPGTCYSVILHSFFLRGAFDHGVLGVVLLYALVWRGLRRSGTSVRDALSLLMLITVSGFSVSAFNNVFVAIVLAVAMGLDRTPRGSADGETGPPDGVAVPLTTPAVGAQFVVTTWPGSAENGRPTGFPRRPV
jgi:hypothetical protein